MGSQRSLLVQILNVLLVTPVFQPLIYLVLRFAYYSYNFAMTIYAYRNINFEDAYELLLANPMLNVV